VETGIRVRVSDTVGAGDTFNGTLAAALARGEALPDAMRWANVAAALSNHGARRHWRHADTRAGARTADAVALRVVGMSADEEYA
jgi:sugar/nucleoside kinase (ribokinase family)